MEIECRIDTYGGSLLKIISADSSTNIIGIKIGAVTVEVNGHKLIEAVNVCLSKYQDDDEEAVDICAECVERNN
jgi:hypothetical protein